MNKRLLSLFLVLVMTAVSLPMFSITASATSVNDPAVHIRQTGSYCTLDSVAMMFRRKAILDGNSNWGVITESSMVEQGNWPAGCSFSPKFVSSSCGLNLHATVASLYSMRNNGCKTNSNPASIISQLKSLLDTHPEGIVLYIYKNYYSSSGNISTAWQHAVTLSSYDSAGNFYCFDPGLSNSNVINLMSSCLTDSYRANTGSLNTLLSYSVQIWCISSANNTAISPQPVVTAAPVHTHSWSYYYESAHPHREYRTCSGCGDWAYTGSTHQVSSCSSCFPLGSVSLTRSFDRTGGKVTFYRNNANNANSYSLKVYKNGIRYGDYTMSGTSQTVNGLGSGTYTAELTARNTNTGQSKTVSCASFTIVDTYQVFYNANGGSGAPSAQTKIQDETMTISSAVPTRAHYIFKGWASTRTATEAQYAAGSGYTKNAKITLYAVWEPEVYSVTYDANGGSGALVNTTVTYGDTTRMPNSIIYQGYFLKGWSTDKRASEPTYKPGLDVAVDRNLALYAVWGNSSWSGEIADSYAGGDGSEEHPYEISDAAELALFADQVNHQESEPEYKYYKLTENIDLRYAEWVPIGVYYTPNQYFYGSFDGNGFAVSNLMITDENETFVGLFGCVKNSSIQNLTVSGEISGYNATKANCIGGIAGYSEDADWTGCSAQYLNLASIGVGTSEYSSFGGIVGKAVGGTIDRCTANETAIGLKSGKAYAGAIVGYTTADLSACKVTATEDGIFDTTGQMGSYSMGAVAGYLEGDATNCSIKAPYLATALNTSAGSQNKIGGLFGEMSGKTTTCSAEFTSGVAKTIDTETYQTSIAASGKGDTSMGGLTGTVGGATALIKDSIYSGQSIAGSTTSGKMNVGGVTGKYSAPTDINIGDYVQMGTYYGAPILWRCVDIDENGPLMLSDKILCLKAFDGPGTNTQGSHGRGYYDFETQGGWRHDYGSNYWGDSNIRDWLNSDASAGNVIWSCGNQAKGWRCNYVNEAGFLTGFTQEERSAMKTVTQKSLLNGYEYSDSSNIINPNYHRYNESISNVLQNYATAFSENVTDTVFLLDVKQIYQVWKNDTLLGGNNYYIGYPTAECVENSRIQSENLTTTKRWYSFLRSPVGSGDSTSVRYLRTYGTVGSYSAYYGDGGIRPGFYLNQLTCTLDLGNGSAESPYLIRNKDDGTGIRRTVVNVDGALSGEGTTVSDVGGMVGKASGDVAIEQSVVIADMIRANDTSSANGNGGYIVGSGNASIDSAYYNSGLELSAGTTNTAGTSRTTRLMKVRSYLTGVLGLTEYQSLDYLAEHPEAVWVIKDGELPQIYYNCLNSIIISKEIEHGSVSADKEYAVDGEVVTVTAQADEGYQINTLYVNGTEMVGTTFEVEGDATIYATFTEETPTYTVEVQATDHAAATLTNVDEEGDALMMLAVDRPLLRGSADLVAEDGDEIEVTADAAEDYTVDAVYVNGEEVAGNSFIVTGNSVVTLAVTSVSTEVQATTGAAENVAATSAEVTGSVESDGDGVARYIRYWSADDPATVYTTGVEAGGGDYEAIILDLEPETTYYYQMGESGAVCSFTTLAEEDEYIGEEPEAEPPVTQTTYKKLTRSYKFTVTTEEELYDEPVIIAAYTAEGQLLGLITTIFDGDTTVTETLPLNEDMACVKIFLWEDFDMMTPLGGAETVIIES